MRPDLSSTLGNEVTTIWGDKKVFQVGRYFLAYHSEMIHTSLVMERATVMRMKMMMARRIYT